VGETEIRAQFITVPVRTVYTDGETIAERSISAGAGDARVFNQLLSLLNEAESLARAKGVLPLLGPDYMYFFAPGTNERVFEALRTIQSLKAPAHVRLLAAQNINTVEPVHVRFEVERE
jgi:hypothetical protein